MFVLPTGLGAKKAGGTTVVLVGVALISAALFGCGGAGGSSRPPVTGTPSDTYMLTVTGTSGSTTQSINLTLTVQWRLVQAFRLN